MVAEPEHNNHTYAQHHADSCSNPGIALRDAVACPKYLHVQINHGGNGLGIGRYRGEQLGPYEKSHTGNAPHGDIGSEHSL